MLNKQVSDFLKRTIESLSKEKFDELVVLFEKYNGYDIVNVDGTNDGGNDILLYKNQRQIKKGVQVTVNKHIESKLKSDLKKYNELISLYGYAPYFDFICSSHLSQSTVEELRKYAQKTYTIELSIYDSNRLSQIECAEIIDFLYGIHGDVLKVATETPVDEITRVLYNVLAGGRDSSNIKNYILNSVIVITLYEEGVLSIEDLRQKVENRIGIALHSILAEVNALKTKHRIERYNNSRDKLTLSTEERMYIEAISISARELENDFTNRLRTISISYGIADVDKLLNELIKLYDCSYQKDLDDVSYEDFCSNSKALDNFMSYLKSVIGDKTQIDRLYEQIKDLCTENDYINKISASSSFLSLYQSNKLEDYISHRDKYIFLDTPTFVYYVCAKYEEGVMWENPYFTSVQSLIKMQENDTAHIHFCIMADYLKEVAGELRKGLQCSWIENTNVAYYLGETKNTFYNFYHYMKANELFEEIDHIDTFEDFVYTLGLENLDVDATDFITMAAKVFYEHAVYFGIQVLPMISYPDYSGAKVIYEKQLGLAGNMKSNFAIRNDVMQVLYLLDKTTSMYQSISEIYVATWDMSFYALRNKLKENDFEGKLGYFYVCNPARLSNRIALENFHINSSCITNDVFLYAERKYDISNKVKCLLELIAPILGKKHSPNVRLIRQLSDMRKTQLEVQQEQETSKQVSTLPIEDAIIEITNYANQDRDRHLFSKLRVYMGDPLNTEVVLDAISKISTAIQYKETHSDDIVCFFEFVRKVELENFVEEIDV